MLGHLVLPVTFILVSSCLITSTPQRANTDERWVWRHLRDTRSQVEDEGFNPFAELSSVPSVSEAAFKRGAELGFFPSQEQIEAAQRASSPPLSQNIKQILELQRNKNPKVQPLAFPKDVSKSTNPHSGFGDHLSIPVPTSNHLPTETDTEPLISSYSSLDANPTVTDDGGLKRSANHKSLLRNSQLSQNQIALGPIEIKPLPIDISTLPLESNERAEGLRKLWSSIMTRNEFVELFQSLTRSSESKERNKPSPNPPRKTEFRFGSNTRSPLDTSANNSNLTPFQSSHQQRLQQQLELQRQQQEKLRQQLVATSAAASNPVPLQQTVRFPPLLQGLNPQRNSSPLQPVHSFDSNNSEQETRDSTFGVGSAHQPTQFNSAPAAISPSELSSDLSTKQHGGLQTSGQFPHKSFTVEKLRLPGNTVANIVFIPSRKSGQSTAFQTSLLESTSALQFFDRLDVQRAIRKINSEASVFVVEEFGNGEGKSYVITTIEGKKVFPSEEEPTNGKSIGGRPSSAIWDELLKRFNSGTDFSPSPVDVQNDEDIFLQSPSRSALTIVNFPPNGIPPPSARQQVTSVDRTPVVPPHFSIDARNPKQLTAASERKFTASSQATNARFSTPDQFHPEEFHPFIPRFGRSGIRRSDISGRGARNSQNNPGATFQGNRNPIPGTILLEPKLTIRNGSTWIWPKNGRKLISQV